MSSTLDASLDDRIPKNSRVTSFTEESLREVFDQYDEQSTGFIDEPALTKLCAQLGLDEGDVPQIMIELDSDLDGKVTFEDFLQKFGSHLMAALPGSQQSNSNSESTSALPNDSQYFFTPELPAGQVTSKSIKSHQQSTPMRSTLMYKKRHFGRWSVSGATNPSRLRSPSPDEDIQFLSPIPNSPIHSRPSSSQDNYPESLTSMMSPFVDPASPRLPHLTQFVSDDENYQDDTGFMYGTAIGQEMMKEPSVREGWLNRSGRSVSLPEFISPMQSFFSFTNVGATNGLKVLVSPEKASADTPSFVPLEEVIDQLCAVGIEAKQGTTIEQVLQQLKLVDENRNVNIQELAGVMDQYLTCEGKDPTQNVMKQIALKAYKSEILLLRNQIEVLNIEKENLQINVSKIMDDKDKLATEVDIDHDELTRRAQELLRVKEQVFADRMKDTERSYQLEMEVIRQNAKKSISQLEMQNERLKNSEEQLRYDIRLYKDEVEAIKKDYEKARQELDVKERELKALLKDSSLQQEYAQIIEENEALKKKIKEMDKHAKMYGHIVELEEQCKELKDRNDVLQSDLEKAFQDVRKYRRKSQILQKREKKLRQENQHLVEAQKLTSQSSPELLTLPPPQASLTGDASESSDEGEKEIDEDDLEDEGVSRSEDIISDIEGDKSLKGELHELEIKALKKKVQKLLKQKSGLSSAMDQLKSDNESALQREIDKLDQLEQLLSNKQIVCQQLESQLVELQGNLDSVNSAREALQTKYEELQVVHSAKISSYEKELLALREHSSQTSDLEDELTEAHEEIEKLKADLKEMRTGLSQEQDRCGIMGKDYQSQIQLLQAQLKQAIQIHEGEVKTIKVELEASQKKMAELLKERNYLEEKVQRQNEKLLESENSFKEMKSQIAAWMKDSTASFSHPSQPDEGILVELDETKNQLSRTLVELGEERKLNHIAAMNLENLKVELQQSQERYDEISQLKDQLEASATRTRVMDEELNRLRILQAAGNILQSGNRDQQSLMERHSKQIAEAKLQLQHQQKEHSREVSELYKELEDIQNQLSGAETKYNELELKFTNFQDDQAEIISAKDEEIQELNSRLLELESQLDTQESELAQKQIENIDLERSLGELETTFENEKSALEQECGSLKDQLAEIATLREEVSELSSKLEKAKEELRCTKEEADAQTENLEFEEALVSAKKENELLLAKWKETKEQLASTQEEYQTSTSLLIKKQEASLKQLQENFEAEKSRTMTLQKQLNEVQALLDKKLEQADQLQQALASEKDMAKQHFQEMQILQKKLDETVDEQKSLRRNCENEVASLEAKVEALESNKAQWLTSRTEFESKIVLLEKSLASATANSEEARHLESEMDLLKEQLRSTTEESKIMTEAKDKEIAQYKAKLNEATIRNCNLQEEFEKVSSEHRKSAKEMEDILQAKRREWLTKEEQLLKKVQSKEEDMLALQQKLSSFPSLEDLQVEQKRVEELEKELQQNDQLLREKNTTLSEMAQETAAKEQEWHATMEELAKQADNLSAEIRAQYGFVDRLKKEQAERETENLDLQKMVRKAQDEMEATSRELALKDLEFSEQLRAKQSKLRNLELSLDAKEDLIEELQGTIKFLQSQFEDAENDSAVEKHKLSEELSRERRLSSELQNQLEKKKEETISLTRQSVDSSSRLQTLESELKEMKEKNALVDSLRDDLSKSKSTISELSADLESFKATLEERDQGYDERVRSYINKMEELDEYTEELRSQNQAISQQMEELIEHNELLEEENKKLQDDFERLQENYILICNGYETYKSEKEHEISSLKEDLATSEFKLEERSLYSPDQVNSLETSLKSTQLQLKLEREKISQLQNTLNLPSNEDTEEVDFGGSPTPTETSSDIHKEIADLKQQLQELQGLLKRKSTILDESLEDSYQLKLQLKEVTMEKAKLQKELEKVTHLHEASLLEEQLKTKEARKQGEPLIKELLKETEKLGEDKMRLAEAVRELQKEREVCLQFVEELARKACQ